jgi:hypothetical protein
MVRTQTALRASEITSDFRGLCRRRLRDRIERVHLIETGLDVAAQPSLPFPLLASQQRDQRQLNVLNVRAIGNTPAF